MVTKGQVVPQDEFGLDDRLGLRLGGMLGFFDRHPCELAADLEAGLPHRRKGRYHQMRAGKIAEADERDVVGHAQDGFAKLFPDAESNVVARGENRCNRYAAA